MGVNDKLCFAADNLKGIGVILTCMSVDSATGTSYTNMPEALSFLAEQIHSIAREIENVCSIQVTKE